MALLRPARDYQRLARHTAPRKAPTIEQHWGGPHERRTASEHDITSHRSIRDLRLCEPIQSLGLRAILEGGLRPPSGPQRGAPQILDPEPAIGNTMLGALLGDYIGSVYESQPIKHKTFPLFHPDCSFTDDSVLTIATAHALMTDTPYAAAYRDFGRRYPNAGYGGMFRRWLHADNAGPYGSFGNGSAMRVSPIGYFFDTLDEVLLAAKASADATHNHPEGVKGAQVTATAIFLLRQGIALPKVCARIATEFGYDLRFRLDDIRPSYSFDVTCQGTVPPALVCCLEATSYEDAIRNAISLGGDADTLACVAGGIAEVAFGLPVSLEQRVLASMPAEWAAIVSAWRALVASRRNDHPTR